MRQQKTPFVTVTSTKDLTFIKELIEAGKITPVIDRTYQFNETPEAFRFLEEEHAQGKVVIAVAEGGVV